MARKTKSETKTTEWKPKFAWRHPFKQGNYDTNVYELWRSTEPLDEVLSEAKRIATELRKICVIRRAIVVSRDTDATITVTPARCIIDIRCGFRNLGGRMVPNMLRIQESFEIDELIKLLETIKKLNEEKKLLPA